MPFTDSAPAAPVPESDSFYGRIYFYVTNDQLAAMLDAGFDEIRAYRRKSFREAFEDEFTTETTRLQLVAGQNNYVIVDPAAKRGYQYMPSVASSTDAVAEVKQTAFITDAIDVAYEQIMTIDELKDLYAWGLLGLFEDEDGNPFPDRLYVHYIEYGITKFETKTNIKVLPTPTRDKHDWIGHDGHNGFWLFQLDERPLVEDGALKVQLVFPGSDPIAIPTEWLDLDTKTGTLTITPASALNSGPAPGFFSSRFSKILPNAWVIDYTAGFALGKLPRNLKDMIGKEASSGPLNIGGDLVGGAAIASQSMSIDGLSQSVNTTSSPTMAGFGARLIQYNNELKRDYPIVIGFYKGIRLQVG